MKPRKVSIVLEVRTSLRIGVLKNKDWWNAALLVSGPAEGAIQILRIRAKLGNPS